MFKNVKIGMRLGLGFGLVLLLLAVIAFIGITRMADIHDKLEDVTKDKYPKTVLATDIIRAMNLVAINNRNTLLLNDPEAIQKQRDERAEHLKVIKEREQKLEEMIKSEEGKKKLEAVKQAGVNYMQTLEKFSSTNRSGDHAGATAILFGEFKPATDAYVTAIRDLITFQDGLMEKTSAEAIETYNSARSLMLIMAAVAILLAIGIAFWVTRSITRPLNEAVGVANALAAGDLTAKIEVTSKDETGQLLSAMRDMVAKLSEIIGGVRSSADALSSASEEVSATAQSMSQATSEQAASVEETSASVEQMSASIEQNTENAKVTDSMASTAARQATEGGQAVNQTVDAMKSIADKIGIIDDIAYQTNLLALNAAIEAARAGEHGKGFAVVAAEVRKLAERSQVAAQEIGEVAKGSVGLAEKAGKLLDEIVPGINKTSDLVQEITAASTEQSAGVSQINTAMTQLNQITQQNASASEELAATAEEMSGQAVQLQEQIAYFKVSDGGARSTPAPVRRAAPAAKASPKVAHPVSSGSPAESGFVPF